jgi:hypothetical protein
MCNPVLNKLHAKRNKKNFALETENKMIQINHQPDATIFQFIILTFICSSTCFGRSPAHHKELNDCSSSLWFYLRIVVIAVLCSWSGRQSKAAKTEANGSFYLDMSLTDLFRSL